MHPELRTELLDRKKQALEEMEQGKLREAKDVFADVEVRLGK